MTTNKDLNQAFYNLLIKGRKEVYNTKLGRAYTTDEPRPTLLAYIGKSLKPYLNYYYTSIEQRNNALNEFIQSLEYADKAKIERKQSRINAVRPNILPGSYFSTSWGYDQTNIDYIVVISVSQTGKTAICKRANSIFLGHDGGCQDVLMPGDSAGDTFIMQVDADGGLHGSYPYIIGDSDKRMGYFHPIKLGEISYQTDAFSGH